MSRTRGPPSASTHPRRARALLSLSAFLVGWAAGWLGGVGYAAGVVGLDVVVVLYCGVGTLEFALLPWLLVMLPLSLTIRPGSALCHPYKAPLFGFALGLAMLALEFGALGAWCIDAPTYALAGLVASTAWSTFAWLLRRAQRGNDARSSLSRSDAM